MKRVGIFGPPRSGTSWLAHIFNSHPNVVLRFQPLFSHGHKGALSPTTSTHEIEAFFDAILQSNDSFALMQTDSQKKYPVFPKQGFPTHLVLKETRYLNVVCNILLSSPDVKIIGIIRNPLATLASWMGAHKEFRASWDISVEWREAPSKNQGRPEEFFGYDKWKQAATEFLGLAEHYPDRFRLLRYDHLIANPESVISDVFQFCGLNMVEQTRSFIRDSRRRHDDDPYSVYRANADDHKWRSVLPEYIAKAVCADLKDDPLSVFIAD